MSHREAIFQFRTNVCSSGVKMWLIFWVEIRVFLYTNLFYVVNLWWNITKELYKSASSRQYFYIISSINSKVISYSCNKVFVTQNGQIMGENVTIVFADSFWEFCRLKWLSLFWPTKFSIRIWKEIVTFLPILHLFWVARTLLLNATDDFGIDSFLLNSIIRYRSLYV